jgi:hypothetical protein
MPTTTSRLPVCLGLLGTLPFIAAAAMAWLPLPAEWLVEKSLLLRAIAGYSAVVLSFLAGIQWGLALSINEDAPASARSLFLLSVAASLMAWGLLFVQAAGTMLLCAIALFCLAWIVDGLLRLQKLIPHWFFRLRSIATFVAIASLLALFART